MKFLIIRFSSIGDIVLTTPVVRCLKRQIVTAEVHFLTKAAFRPVLEANPYIDKLHLLGDDWDGMIKELQAADFDYVIDLHHNVRTLKVKKALGKQAFSFRKLNIEKWLYTNFKWNRMPDEHIVDRYLATVRSFGVRNDGMGLDYFIPKADELKPEDIPTAHQAGYIGVVIGAALATKQLPLHKLKDVCAAIPHPLILLGGPEDATLGEQLAAMDPIRIYNACGKFNLNESAGLVRLAKSVVTHDTGLMHIAAAFKRPIVSVWGNTVPEFGMYPYYGARAQPNEVMEVRPLSCRPCSKIGYKKCPKGHFKCMEQQSFDKIAGAAMKLRSFSLVAGLLLLLAGCEIDHSKELKVLNRRALVYSRNHQQKEAIKCFMEANAFKDVPDSLRTTVMENLGNEYWYYKNDSAKYFYLQAAMLNRKNSYHWLFAMANYHVLNQRLDSALPLLLRAYERDSLKFQACNMIGVIYMGEYGEDYYDPAKALRFNLRYDKLVNDVYSAFSVAKNYYLVNEMERSVAVFQMMHTKYPDYTPAIGSLAMIYEELGRTEEARALLEELRTKDYPRYEHVTNEKIKAGQHGLTWHH